MFELNNYIVQAKAEEWAKTLEPESVDLLLTDPPYYEIVDETWDNQWSSPKQYSNWLVNVINSFMPALKPHASVLIFQAVGKDGIHPIFDIVTGLEKFLCYRNWITWKKRRAYGKSHDYLFCREEILWFSVDCDRTAVSFNIPLSDVKRGYDGFNPKYKAKSEYKRISNVFDDIPELMRPERQCQKPLDLIDRFIKTHSNPGDLVIDPFVGRGTTGISALRLGRRFLGCDVNPDAVQANERCNNALKGEVIFDTNKNSDVVDLDKEKI